MLRVSTITTASSAYLKLIIGIPFIWILYLDPKVLCLKYPLSIDYSVFSVVSLLSIGIFAFWLKQILEITLMTIWSLNLMKFFFRQAVSLDTRDVLFERFVIVDEAHIFWLISRHLWHMTFNANSAFRVSPISISSFMCTLVWSTLRGTFNVFSGRFIVR